MDGEDDYGEDNYGDGDYKDPGDGGDGYGTPLQGSCHCSRNLPTLY